MALREEPARLSPAQRRGSLVAVIASAGVVGLTFGLSMPLLALLLERDGVDPTWIGLNASMASVAVLVAGPLVPRVLDRFGVLPSLYGSVAAVAAIFLLLPLWYGLGPWFVLRFLLGACGAVHWIICETWILSIPNRANRGRIVALYLTLLSAGFAIGPLLIGLVGLDGWTPFVTSAGLIALSAVPLLLARSSAPRLPPRAPAAFANALRRAPLILAAAVLAGFTDTAHLSLLPIFGLQSGLEREQALLLLSVTLAGSMILQLPIGWLADRVDRRRLLIALGLVMLAVPPALPQLIETGAFLWPALLIWGGASIGLYTLGLTILGDRFAPAEIAGANAAFVAFFEAGSMLGPIAGGAGMDLAGGQGYLLVLAAAAAAFIAFGVLRGVGRTYTKEQ